MPDQQARVVLHLGAHKTGTTAIQRHLRARTAQLRSRGWDFHDGSLGPERNALNVVSELADTPSPELRAAALDAVRARVGDALDEIGSLVVVAETLLGSPRFTSADGLYPAAARVLDVVAEACRDTPVEVVYAVRAQPDFVESFYIQLVKQGRSEIFPSFASRMTAAGLAWTGVVDAVAERFDSPAVVPYESLATDPGGAAGWFCRHLGVDDLAPSAAERRNVSLSEKGLLVALAAMPLLDSDERKRLRQYLQRNLGQDANPAPRLLSDTGRNRLLAAVAPSNRALFERRVTEGADALPRYLPASGWAAPADAGSPTVPVVTAPDDFAAVWTDLATAHEAWTRAVAGPDA